MSFITAAHQQRATKTLAVGRSGHFRDEIKKFEIQDICFHSNLFDFEAYKLWTGQNKIRKKRFF